jgi:hypothetical protein
MDVVPVDPRDQRWEQDRPRYRVAVWNRHYRGCADYEISEAIDVEQVLRWARENTPPGGHHTIAVVSDQGDGSIGLIVIGGDADPPGVTATLTG